MEDVLRVVRDNGLRESDDGGEEEMQVSYERPKSGGRRRMDGVDVRWEVTFPSPGIERGSLPFWCHDVTPRELRVPSDESAVRHACGAVGVAEVRIVARGQDLESCRKVYEVILGVEREDSRVEKGWRFRIPQPRVESAEAVIILREPKDAFEEGLLERQSVAIAEVVLTVEKDGNEELPSIEEKFGEHGFRISFAQST